jgi:hypothetical protein
MKRQIYKPKFFISYVESLDCSQTFFRPEPGILKGLKCVAVAVHLVAFPIYQNQPANSVITLSCTRLPTWILLIVLEQKTSENNFICWIFNKVIPLYYISKTLQSEKKIKENLITV